jgi:hypothetical protein
MPRPRSPEPAGEPFSSEPFVERLHRVIHAFAQEAGVGQAFVEVELEDGVRFVVDAVSADPGYGFLTFRLHRRNDEDPDQVVVPIRAIRRIELDKAEEQRAPFGFSLPS